MSSAWAASRSMAAAYALNRGTFQGSYARECFDRLRARPGVALQAGGRLLDVGSGTGEVTRELVMSRFGEALGVDISPDMTAHATRHHGCDRVRFRCFDLGASELEHDQFEAAVSFMALHWPSVKVRVQLLSNVRKLLGDGAPFLGGLHGQSSCKEQGHHSFRDFTNSAAASGREAIDAIDTVMSSNSPSLYEHERSPSMFVRSSEAEWRRDFVEAGFSDVDVQSRCEVTEYFTHEALRSRLVAAWPPTFATSLSKEEVDALLDAAATEMARRHARSPSRREGVLAVMTNNLIEFAVRNVK